MTARRIGKLLTQILLVLLLVLAASVFGTLAAEVFANNDAAPSEPAARLLSAAPSHTGEVV